MTLTQQKIQEREKYILKKFNSRKWSIEYMHKVKVYLLEAKPYNQNIGYCGKGNDSCKRESVSSFLVPDFKSKNFSCWAHDTLWNAVKDKLMNTKDVHLFFYYSMLFDAGWNPIKRASAYIYYKSVKNMKIK